MKRGKATRRERSELRVEGVYSQAEAALAAKIRPSRIRAAVRSGQLPTLGGTGRQVRLYGGDVLGWLAAGSPAGPTTPA